MGWSIGAGLVMLMLLVFSLFAIFLAILRFFMRSDQKHVACILDSCLCWFQRVCNTTTLVDFPTIAFEILALRTNCRRGGWMLGWHNALEKSLSNFALFGRPDTSHNYQPSKPKQTT